MTRDGALDGFSSATRAWFDGSFAEPTPAQAGAWRAIGNGEDTLVVAPTGSGKTLAAFLWAIDKLAAVPPPADPKLRCRVLYVSPLKALAVDIERNLRAPLTGIGHAARRLGLQEPDIRVAVRTGDTAAEERRKLASKPPDILITTPESLFLLLTSQARETLRGVETVIVDEVHAVAGNKRGAHLALSLERLDSLRQDAQPGQSAEQAGRAAQRVGLSATVRPVEEVAAFLGGTRAVTVVQPPSTKCIELKVVVPVEDMTELDTMPGRGGEDEEDSGGGPAPRRSIWPHVEERVLDLIEQHKSTIVFVNSRRLAERLCARLNELAAERAEGEWAEPPHERGVAGGRPPGPAEQAGAATGAPLEVARAHHGSVSRQERAEIEEALKAGRLPAVVATSSLELGIDMGAVDLVVQVEAPPSVASGLQRVGRAGHNVGDVSRGIIFPKYQGDLVQCGRGGRTDAGGRDRGTEDPAQPAGRARPADRGDDGGRRLAGGRARADGPQGRAVRGPDQADPRSGTGHAGRALPERGFRRAPAAHHLGPGAPAPSGPGRVRSGSPSPAAAPFPTAGCSGSSLPRTLVLATRASSRGGWGNSTRRWCTSRGSATCSCSAPAHGGSRT